MNGIVNYMLLLSANLEEELTIMFIIMFLILLTVICLTIIKKIKAKDD